LSIHSLSANFYNIGICLIITFYCDNFWFFYYRWNPISSSSVEPKFIVFYTNLLALFSVFCFKCKASEPKVKMKKNGTAVCVEQECSHCMNTFQWNSQPLILSKYQAGNILLSFAVLVSGASISKILLVFRHLGLSVYHIRTFFRHQSDLLLPTIIRYWNSYQDGLLSKWKKVDTNIWSGDGRFDSMGHSAKYCMYTFMNCTEMKIGHFELLQASIISPNNYLLFTCFQVAMCPDAPPTLNDFILIIGRALSFNRLYHTTAGKNMCC
jgi:hypothetical protein